MSNFREHRVWCEHCGKFVPTIHNNTGCNQRYMVDLDNPTILFCCHCGDTYPIDGNFCCPFNHNALVRPKYVTSTYSYHFGDTELSRDGDMVYIQQFNGTIIAARRSLLVGFA